MNQSEMLEEYDFSMGERGKYSEASKAGSNIIRLDPDVAAVFHDSKQVNDLLRTIVQSVKYSSSPTIKASNPQAQDDHSQGS